MNCDNHSFPEEQEPSGRLILAPCLSCGMSAADGLLAAMNEQAPAFDAGFVAGRSKRSAYESRASYFLGKLPKPVDPV